MIDDFEAIVFGAPDEDFRMDNDTVDPFFTAGGVDAEVWLGGHEYIEAGFEEVGADFFFGVVVDDSHEPGQAYGVVGVRSHRRI